MICLDNSVLSRFASETEFPAVTAYLSAHSAEPWTIPAVVAYEYYSYFDTDAEVRRQQRLLDERFDAVLPVTDGVASETARIENAFDSQGVSLDTADLLHAATARNAGATFVTCDVNDFDKPPIRDLLDVDFVDPE